MCYEVCGQCAMIFLMMPFIVVNRRDAINRVSLFRPNYAISPLLKCSIQGHIVNFQLSIVNLINLSYLCLNNSLITMINQSLNKTLIPKIIKGFAHQVGQRQLVIYVGIQVRSIGSIHTISF